MFIVNGWEIEEGTIYTVSTMGGEFVGKISEYSEPTILRVINPRLVMNGPDGSQQYVPACSISGDPDVKYVDFNMTAVVTIVPTEKQYSKAYMEATSGLVLPHGAI